MKRRLTRRVMVGDIPIGGGAPVVVQSMTNTETSDVEATVAQINSLALAGAEIVRVSVPTVEGSFALREIISRSPVPVVADVHFSHRIALAAIRAGVAKLRINPGNITKPVYIAQIAEAAASKGIPIRIGVNAGSLPKDLLAKYGRPTAEAMLEAAERELELLDRVNFDSIVVSLKSSDAYTTIEANRLFSARYDYPLHLGVTEAGVDTEGIIESSVGIGTLLAEGIGDTIRVSLAGDPVRELPVAYRILSSLGLRECGPRVVVCPSCARAKIDVESIAKQISNIVKGVKKPLRIAVMGCVVNGPGEAKEADIGVAGGEKTSAIFQKGKVVLQVRNENLLSVLKSEIKKLIDEADA